MPVILSGVDEAGRGSVFGPLIIVGVTLDQESIQKLVAAGLKDSKLFTSATAQKKRDKLANKIKEYAQQTLITEITAQNIDQTLKNRPRDNLNLLELREIGNLIVKLTASELVVDTIGPPIYARKHLMRIIQSRDDQIQANPISCTNDLCVFDIKPHNGFEKRVMISTGGDRKFPVVSAASCVSKSIRDERLREIEQEWGLPSVTLGKGYPHATDSAITSFLENYRQEIQDRYFPFIRYSWAWPKLQNILHPPPKTLDELLQPPESME
ncbi:MAG: hypothetical protein ACFFE8_00825 [Candidatus Heimdallarchaeota archaeon]